MVLCMFVCLFSDNRLLQLVHLSRYQSANHQVEGMSALGTKPPACRKGTWLCCDCFTSYCSFVHLAGIETDIVGNGFEGD